MDAETGAFGEKRAKNKIKEHLMTADGGDYAGERLTDSQSVAVITVLKEIKAAQPGQDLSIAVKARLAGTILQNLGEVLQGADQLTFS